MHKHIIVLSGTLHKLLREQAFFPADMLTPNSSIDAESHQLVVVGWGRKPTTIRARALADALGCPYWALEDGFIRSVGMGQEEYTLSIVVDDLGIYYDATRPSRLEHLIQTPLNNNQLYRARQLQQLWRVGSVSKYNHQRIASAELPSGFVLVVDQTYGDAAIEYGGASANTFGRMLDAAITENPSSPIVLKVHPEVMAGRKRGHFDVKTLRANSRITLLVDDIHPAELLPLAAKVYVVTSQMGFDALIWGVPVRCFGMPFYAGWGLTSDELPAPTRRGSATLEQLIHAALVAYPRYVNPETRQQCEVEDVLAHLALQRRMRSRLPAILHALDFSKWKIPIVESFCWGSQVVFFRSQVPATFSNRVHILLSNMLDAPLLSKWIDPVVERFRSGKRGELPCEDTSPTNADQVVLAWGRKGIDSYARPLIPHEMHESAVPPEHPNPRISVEDGFIRSVGLGADLIRPLSWVFDQRGIYYDATQPSDLEHLLEHADMDEALLARARALRERIVAAGLTKYNVGSGSWLRPDCGKQVVLVAGQVESDASIRYGAGVIHSNMALLQAVRGAHPEAWIVYKPHPDVLAGLREHGENENDALNWCNEIVTDIPMADLLGKVDAVHVMTSLTGFEALLRGVPVEVWGMPFYAGWGLTHDHINCNRRNRQRSLDELVAAALILYPVYVSRVTGRYTTPERALDELISWRQSPQARLPWWRVCLRKILPYV